MAVKIIANLGPASLKPKTIRQMSKEGMDVARLKSCFYTASSLDKTIKLIRKNSRAKIMVDFEGDEIRIYGPKDKPIKKRTPFWLGFAREKNKRFYFNRNLLEVLDVGDKLVFDKSMANVFVKKKAKDKILLEADNDLVLRNGKGFNVGSKDIDFKKMSKKDLELIETANKNHAEYAALSFTQSANDVFSLRKHLHKKCLVCAKIENHTGLKHLREITQASDLVMVARGDLSAEFPIEEIPFIQEKIISACKRFRKKVIVATDILESMKNGKVPFNSEINDLVWIAMQGADMVLITSPTAIGKNPVETIAMAKKILGHAKKFS